MIRSVSAIGMAAFIATHAIHADDLPAPLNATELIQLLEEEKFADIEKIENEARTSRAINSVGFWQLSRFYTVFENHLEPQAIESIEQVRTKLAPWSKAYPDSVTWRIVLADQLINRGWNARGGGWASTVTPNGWKEFDQYLTEAWSVLKEAQEIDPEHPHIYVCLLSIGMGLGEDPTQPVNLGLSRLRENLRGLFKGPVPSISIEKAIFDEAIEHERSYWGLYEGYAIAILPRGAAHPAK